MRRTLVAAGVLLCLPAVARAIRALVAYLSSSLP
jgi:hypothetical protein